MISSRMDDDNYSQSPCSQTISLHSGAVLTCDHTLLPCIKTRGRLFFSFSLSKTMPDRRLERCILGRQAAPTLPKKLKLKKIGKPSGLVPHCKFYFSTLNSSQGNCTILGKLNLQRLTVRRLGLFTYRSIPKPPIPPLGKPRGI